MSRARRPIRRQLAAQAALLLLVLGAGLATVPLVRAAEGSATSADAGRELASALLTHLGFDARALAPVLHAGTIVHSGLQGAAELPEEVTAVGAMVVVPGVRPAQAAAVFLAPQIFHDVHRVTRREAITPGEVDWIGRHLAVGDEQAAANLLTRPARDFNLSAREAGLALAAGRQSGDASLRAAGVMARILEERARSFHSGGLPAIEAYVREDGRRVDPRSELEVAIRQLGFLDEDYPELMAILRGGAAGSGRLEQTHCWMEVPFQGHQVFALARELRLVAPDRAVAADLHFYASRAYNAMLTLVGVVPYGDGSLVFAISHLFTDAVLGVGTGLKRTVARREAGALLLRHLEAVRGRMSE